MLEFGFLLDRQGNLTNAQEGNTKGLRQWRFNSIKDIDAVLILEYMKEAMVDPLKLLER